ncbi:MAG: hypothetical protein WA705_25610 [Candidatus Ozemobacteraceae bacterium]
MTHRLRFFVLAVFIFTLLSTSTLFALHEFYNQNGDCYMLIGEGPCRGVYALNNLTGGGITRLYDPQDAYGITANQTWNGSSCLKYVYTFAGLDTGWVQATGNISRAVNTCDWKGRRFYFPGERTDSPIRGEWHDPSGCGASGVGNHTVRYSPYGINGYDGDYPCHWKPTPDPAKSGFCFVSVGKYYHSFLQNGCHSGGHWLIREKVQTKTRKIDLYQYQVTARVGPTIQSTVANVNLGEKRSMDQIHECHDGCVRAQSDVPLPGSEVPYVDCVYSTRLNRSYLYRREPSNSAYTLTGTDGNSQLVGTPGNLSTKFIGISSKNNAGDFVYTIGIDLLNKWLKDANAPFTISQLDDVAVSDQWWLSGGIVYAYDRSQKKVYKFVRDEISNKPSIPEQIVVFDGGVLPDSINADGFGHLYLIKTVKEPDGAATTFLPKDAKSYVKQVDYLGRVTYNASFEQKVYKAVQKRDYYTKEFSIVPGKVLLGTNYFNRTFTSATPANLTTWVWTTAPVQNGVDVQSSYRTELAAINCATPPQVGNPNAVTDVNGPLISTSTGLKKAVPESDGYYKDLQTYIFSVENAPYFDINGVNIGNTGLDQDGDTRIGLFPSTAKKVSIKYYWKVVLTKDWTSNATTSVLLDQEAAGTPSTDSLLAVKLGAGEYDVGCKLTYQYYDYNKLPLGALADAKETVLSNLMTGKGEDSKNYAWEKIRIKPAASINFPGGWCVVMSGRPSSAGAYSYRPIRPTDAACPQCSTTQEFPVGARFVIPEKVADWSIKLRESDFNTSKAAPNNVDRFALMAKVDPPDPQDPRLITGSLEWMGDSKFTWTSKLERGAETVFPGQIITSIPYLTRAELKLLCPIPSQPRAYKLKASGARSYKYRTFIPNTRLIAGELITEYIETPMQKEIAVLGECEIVITDETGPMAAFTDPLNPSISLPAFFSSQAYLYGTTGERLDQVESPPDANPTSIDYVVADNNPMGNDLAPGEPALLTYVDPFFSAIDARCRVQHRPDNRMGLFQYSTVGLGVMPSALPLTNTFRSNVSSTIPGPDGTYKLEQKDLTAADFTLPWLKATSYSKCFSYRRYSLAFSTLANSAAFSRNRSGTQAPEMDLGYANNVTGYKNLTYGLSWREACNLATGPYMLGQIVIRDNDRPNIFIKAYEMKNDLLYYYAPSNVQLSFINGGSWARFGEIGQSEANHNGLVSWTGPNIQGIDPFYKINSGFAVTASLTANGFGTTGPEIEIDVPTFFQGISCDNTGGTATVTFSLLKGTKTLFDGKLERNIRFIFRTAGDYRVNLTVDDRAKKWPSDPNTPTVADLSPNRRDLDCAVRVFQTRLDIRVIDKTGEGR